mmetsp:Transcript_483/g.1712  ORF Transcript_483/g.1712 Transcript_483/m.1712 type:complete len:198 (-) Transcript_483:30-623(-)
MRSRGVSPDVPCLNAVLAACRRSGAADDVLRLWNEIVAEGSGLKPDAITAMEAVATLERAQRRNDADQVYADAVRFGVEMQSKPLSLDDDHELDVSGMTLPLARCAVRKAVRDLRATKDVVFITGVGARKGPAHTSLRSHVVEMLATDFTPPILATVPADAPGCVVVDKESWLRFQAAALAAVPAAAAAVAEPTEPS